MKKVALVTGASEGIGKALAIEAAKRGFNVGLMARNEATLKVVADNCKAEGVMVSIYVGDVSIEADCQSFANQCIRELGGINVLINNAGISMRAVFAETELSVIKKLMDVNFWGTVYCTKYCLDELLKNKGSVVGISSIAGFKGLPARTGYSASKFAINGFLESLRTENLKTGLHVLIACPGYTASNIRNAALDKSGKAQGETPLNESNLVQPREVANQIWNAIEKKKMYLILTFQGKMAVWINKWFPALADRLTFNHIRKEKDSPFK